jgi:hypothetical protein
MVGRTISVAVVRITRRCLTMRLRDLPENILRSLRSRCLREFKEFMKTNEGKDQWLTWEKAYSKGLVVGLAFNEPDSKSDA